MTAKKAAPKRTGKATNLYMADAEMTKVRELAAWLQGQGIRTSDSRVICAAVRTAKADRHLKEAYEEIAGHDARRVENK
jgi:uncharacterized protein YecT (DUF1311 family)